MGYRKLLKVYATVMRSIATGRSRAFGGVYLTFCYTYDKLRT